MSQKYVFRSPDWPMWESHCLVGIGDVARVPEVGIVSAGNHTIVGMTTRSCERGCARFNVVLSF